jgi:hypothetical protein
MTMIDEAVLDTLDTQPFSSFRELAQFTSIPTGTVYRHFTKSPGFGVKQVHSIPHTLKDSQKAQPEEFHESAGFGLHYHQPEEARAGPLLIAFAMDWRDTIRGVDWECISYRMKSEFKCK